MLPEGVRLLVLGPRFDFDRSEKIRPSTSAPRSIHTWMEEIASLRIPTVHDTLYLRALAKILDPLELAPLFQPNRAMLDLAGLLVTVARDHQAAALSQVRKNMRKRLLDLLSSEIVRIQYVARPHGRDLVDE